MTRFTIRRSAATAYPWTLRDAARPMFLGQYASHSLAVSAADRCICAASTEPTA